MRTVEHAKVVDCLAIKAALEKAGLLSKCVAWLYETDADYICGIQGIVMEQDWFDNHREIRIGSEWIATYPHPPEVERKYIGEDMSNVNIMGYEV